MQKYLNHKYQSEYLNANNKKSHIESFSPQSLELDL